MKNEEVPNGFLITFSCLEKPIREPILLTLSWLQVMRRHVSLKLLLRRMRTHRQDIFLSYDS